jgi:hypothetical protein
MLGEWVLDVLLRLVAVAGGSMQHSPAAKLASTAPCVCDVLACWLRHPAQFLDGILAYNLLLCPLLSASHPLHGRCTCRTLHTATDAVDEKWVSQLWLVSALPQLPPKAAGGVAGARAQPLGNTSSSKTKRAKRKK